MIPTRRQFILAAGSAALLTACGDDSGSKASETSDTGNSAPPGFGIIKRFPNVNLFTPGEVRLPVSLTDGQAMMATGPDRLTGWIESSDGTRVAEIDAPRRNQGIDFAYWEVRATLDSTEVHTLRLEGDDGYGASFQVVAGASVASPVTGTELPPFDTPTVDDHRGVEPYCSLPPPCSLHEMTLTDALASGKPVVYMVGTPAHCQTGTCAPGLEFLVAEHERLGDAVMMVHADVYADEAATELAPAVIALNVEYEPIVYLCDAEGIVVDRLDAVWDASELRERLDLLLS